MLNQIVENKKVIYIFLLITGIPHLFHMPLLLNLYILFFFIYTYFIKNINKNLALWFFVITGLIFGLIEYIKFFNILSLIKANIFIDIVSSLLVYVITLQFISDYKSPLMKISPILLLMTSLFYYNNIYYLFYTIFVLFAAVNIVIISNSSLSFKKSIKFTTSIFVTSIPFVIILFLIFPRISYKKGDFGFREQTLRVSGFGDNISLGDGEELLTSNQIVMEIGFIDKKPKENQLYFRGAVLYNYDGVKYWATFRRDLQIKKLNYKNSDLFTYNVTLYPTHEFVLFTLDLPISKIKFTTLDKDYILRNQKPLKDTKRYNVTSAIEYNNFDIDENIKKISLISPMEINPKTKQLAKEIISKSKDDEEVLINIIDFFKKANLKYTLKPTNLLSKDVVDELLFETKNGYCVHFSTAFAILAREAKLPTRIVTGYKASFKENINNYLLIREKDAHSWNEVYLKKRGWVRIDATTYASIEKQNNTLDMNQTKEIKAKNKINQQIYLYMMYIKYTLDDWILNYNYLKQLKLINDIKKDKTLIIYYFVSILILIFVIYKIYTYLLESKIEDTVLIEYRKFLKKLEKKGFVKESFEGANSFFDRIDEKLDSKEFKNITNLYIKLRYQKDFNQEEFDLFKQMIKNFK